LHLECGTPGSGAKLNSFNLNRLRSDEQKQLVQNPQNLERQRLLNIRYAKDGSKRKGITMGLFWDLIQQSQISNQQTATSTLEQRVARLEAQIREMQQTQLSLLKTLETNFGRDLDGDGRVG
jgi:hypothetical protein